MKLRFLVMWLMSGNRQKNLFLKNKTNTKNEQWNLISRSGYNV